MHDRVNIRDWAASIGTRKIQPLEILRAGVYNLRKTTPGHEIQDLVLFDAEDERLAGYAMCKPA